MMYSQIAHRVMGCAARFARAERGNVAMMFALVLPVLLTSVGTAVDYSRAANARAAMQAAADATALMISKEAVNLTATQVTSQAQAYFNALFDHPEVTGITFSATYSANSGTGATVVVTASGTMPTDFMKLAGHSTMPLDVSSTTRWGNIRYRVALALDNTGSMASSSKMTELKSAATKLINDFYDIASGSADVYISIVPFARDVNVGTGNAGQPWLRWTEWEEKNGSCSGSNGSSYTTKTACEGAGRTWTASSHDSWTGCVMDRDQNYDTTSTTPTTSVIGTLVPAEQYADCPVPLLPMTSVKASKQTLLNKIADMLPDGSTNQGIGAFWAWQTLLLTGPFPAPAKDSNYIYQDVLVLLTDGLNTQSRFYGNGFQHSTSVDARQALLCTNARAQGIKIFAIQVATGGEAVSTVTKNCTSDPENPNYFNYITQASQMTVQFQAIFKELARLRVAM